MEHNEPGQALFAQACDEHRNGRIDEAEALYRRAVIRDPKLLDAWRNLGALLRQQGKAEEGLKCQLNALKLKPDDAGILSNIGNALETYIDTRFKRHLRRQV